MKKYIYIFLFTLFGFLLQFLIHALVEQWYIKLLLADFQTYGLGLDWSTWFRIHHILTIILILVGVLVGFWQGIFWWKRLYENKH